jgi:hypothetical protein
MLEPAWVSPKKNKVLAMGSPTCAGWPATADPNASPEPAPPQLPDELEAFLAPDDANLPVVLFTLGEYSSYHDDDKIIS